MASKRAATDDPAAAIALNDAEIAWVGDFLASEEVPDTVMPLEALDGFLTALVVGPETVPCCEFMPVIWDTAERVTPVFDDPARLPALNDLLSRHRQAIARQIDNGSGH